MTSHHAYFCDVASGVRRTIGGNCLGGRRQLPRGPEAVPLASGGGGTASGVGGIASGGGGTMLCYAEALPRGAEAVPRGPEAVPLPPEDTK